jgi:uncharacterized membrane protein YdjX (TVP38/TMEM64 family)
MQTRTLRLITLLVWLILIATALTLAFGTQKGRRFMANPHHARADVRAWVHHRHLIAPATFVAVYLVVAMAGLPVWWLQITAGFAFGLGWGIFWCALASTLAACACFVLARFVLREWFEKRVESRMAKLHTLAETLGHNGLLTVMVIRLMHVMPFGLSNYAFGLTHMTFMDVALGTALGNLPAITFSVTAGVDHHIMRTMRFWVIVTGMHLLLLVPIAIRYLKPRWFKKIGVE